MPLLSEGKSSQKKRRFTCALISRSYLSEKNAEKAEIATNLTMHISRHAFAHIAQQAGAESSTIKNIPGHSNLATTEQYMGSFNTSKTDNTLRTLFKKKPVPEVMPQEGTDSSISQEEQAIELPRGMTPEQIMAVISAINKQVIHSPLSNRLKQLFCDIQISKSLSL